MVFLRFLFYGSLNIDGEENLQRIFLICTGAMVNNHSNSLCSIQRCQGVFLIHAI